MVKICKTVQVQLMDGRDEMEKTVDQYVKAMNFVSRFAMAHKTWNNYVIHQHVYGDIRKRFGLRSQMTVSAIRDVTARYNGQLKKNRTHATPVTFKRKAMRLNYPRDYGFKPNDTVSINTIHGRMGVSYKCGTYQRALLDSDDWKVKSSVLTIRKDGVILLYVVVEKEIPPTSFLNKDGVVGVDVGMNFVAVTTDTTDTSRFYGGGTVKYKRWLFQKHRTEGQSKGTRSAKRFLHRIRRRERRFVTDQNHCIAKDIVTKALQRFNSPIIAMEDLKGIRQQKYIGKTHRTRLNTRAFYQLQQFIEYKAVERGILVVYVDPKYTSQTCPKCGHVEKGNRNRKLHQFKCKACTYTSNDDRVASMIIRDRGVVPRYIRGTRGTCQVPSCNAS